MSTSGYNTILNPLFDMKSGHYRKQTLHVYPSVGCSLMFGNLKKIKLSEIQGIIIFYSNVGFFSEMPPLW